METKAPEQFKLEATQPGTYDGKLYLTTSAANFTCLKLDSPRRRHVSNALDFPAKPSPCQHCRCRRGWTRGWGCGSRRATLAALPARALAQVTTPRRPEIGANGTITHLRPPPRFTALRLTSDKRKQFMVLNPSFIISVVVTRSRFPSVWHCPVTCGGQVLR